MFPSIPHTSRIIHSHLIVGSVATRGGARILTDRGTNAGIVPQDDLARLALVPSTRVAITPRDELSRLGLCCCSTPVDGHAAAVRWGDRWM
jgi:hypothetical protein